MRYLVVTSTYKWSHEKTQADPVTYESADLSADVIGEAVVEAMRAVARTMSEYHPEEIVWHVAVTSEGML